MNIQNENIELTFAESSLGTVLVARSAAGVCAVLLGDDRSALKRDLHRRFPGAVVTDGGPVLAALATDVVALVESPGSRLNVALDMRGTEFQRRVWQSLRGIPPGSTVSYSEIADRIGSPKAAQEVAEACAANALAVVVPCHRVVKKNGALSGYRWGVERKRALLAREAAR